MLAVAADLSTAEGAEKVVNATLEAFGGIDILINNVGTAKGTDIVNTADGEWQDALDHTLYPAIRMSRLVVPHMRARGNGSIVMIASIWGRESGGRMVYNAVKAAEISLAKAMAQQLAKDGIRVNSVAPGSILFPGGSWESARQGRSGRHGRVRTRRAPVRTFWPGRRSGRRRGVSRLAAGELDQRLICDSRRLPVAVANLIDRFILVLCSEGVALNSG